MLHVDGLADTADGLLPHADRAPARDHAGPGVGAFGVTAVAPSSCCGAAPEPARDVALLVALWCAARTVASVAAAWSRTREEGLASAFLTAPAAWPLLALRRPLRRLGRHRAASPRCRRASSRRPRGARPRRLGGFTGDVLGAAIVVGQTVGLSWPRRDGAPATGSSLAAPPWGCSSTASSASRRRASPRRRVRAPMGASSVRLPDDRRPAGVRRRRPGLGVVAGRHRSTAIAVRCRCGRMLRPTPSASDACWSAGARGRTRGLPALVGRDPELDDSGSPPR